MHQDRPHHGLDLSILSGAVLIPKPILIINTVAIEGWRIAANIAKLPKLVQRLLPTGMTSIAERHSRLRN